MVTSSVEFGDKHVGAARGGNVPRPEINCAVEDAGGVHVAGTIHRHPTAVLGAGTTEGGGPLMSTSSIEFGDVRIAIARGGHVPRPEVDCAMKVAAGVDVAGTIHRHRPAVID